MDSTVKVRPNHYELLGLSPTAKLDEIDEAFARELRLPRAFGSLAEFTVAYETLRDPAKRKAYDASIFKPEAKPEPKPALSLAGRLEGAALAMRPVAQHSTSPSRPIAIPRLRPEPRPQARTAPSVTALLRQPSTPIMPERDPVPRMVAESPRPTEAMTSPRTDSLTRSDDVLREPAVSRARHDWRDPTQWKLPALAAGALVLAVGGGAWMGVESGNVAEQDQLKPAVTLKVPPAKAASSVVASSDDRETSFAEEQPAIPKPAATPRKIVRPPLQIDLPDEQPTEVAALEQQQRAIAAEDVAAPSPAVSATAAEMPLPNSVIARTIGRIGYPCGQVASTAALDGAGVFKVTCTSGHAYRAAPVNGRYRFKRMGKS